MSLPTYAVASSETPRRATSSRRTGSLSSTPWMHAAPIFRARAATASFTSVERMRWSTPTSSSRRSPNASPRQQATLSSPRSFVQTRLSVKTPSKSKTTKRIASRSITLRERRRPALQARGRRERRPARPRAAARACVRAGRRARTAAGRRPPATWRPGRPERGRAPLGDLGRDELLSHLLKRPLLARQAPLHAVAERRRNALEVADEPAHPVGHERVRVIGALPGVVEREVLLEHARAEHVGNRGHRDPVVVVGEPDDELGIALA